MRNAKRTTVELEAHGLDVDETRSGLLCPFCNGGRSGEKTFSVTRISDGILHNCYRASCTEGRGFVPTSGILRDPSRVREHQKPDRPYEGEWHKLEASDRAYFLDRFDLGAAHTHSIGHNGQGQYVFEVHNPQGMVRGYVVRKKAWDGMEPPRKPSFPVQGTKTKVFMNDSQQVQLAWTHFGGTAKIVLTEDVLSALKVTQSGMATGVALLSSDLSEPKVREIASYRPEQVTIALDQDATAKAFKIAAEWGLAFRKTRVLVLARDLKDEAAEEVSRLVGNI